MKRIAVVGSGGAGKSTLARRLGDKLGIPVIHLDAHYWNPGWIPTPHEEWRPIVQELTSGEEWIIDGNYGRTMDIRLPLADTVIFLDFPRWLCLWRVLKRRVQYQGRTRPDMNSGCPEKVDAEFLAWVWNFPKRAQMAVLGKIEVYGQHAQVVHLRSPREVERFMADLSPKAGDTV